MPSQISKRTSAFSGMQFTQSDRRYRCGTVRNHRLLHSSSCHQTMLQRSPHSLRALHLERYWLRIQSTSTEPDTFLADRRRQRYHNPQDVRCRAFDSCKVDIKALTPDDRNLLESARPAFKKYNEEQLTTVKLPGGSKNVSRYDRADTLREDDL